MCDGAQTQSVFGPSDDACSSHANGGSGGGGERTGVDPAYHECKDQCNGPDRNEGLEAVALGQAGLGSGGARHHAGVDRDCEHIAQHHQNAGNESGGEKLLDVFFREDGVDDQHN